MAFQRGLSQATRSWTPNDQTCLPLPPSTMWRSMSALFLIIPLSKQKKRLRSILLSTVKTLCFFPQTFQVRAHVYQVWKTLKHWRNINNQNHMFRLLNHTTMKIGSKDYQLTLRIKITPIKRIQSGALPYWLR